MFSPSPLIHHLISELALMLMSWLLPFSFTSLIRGFTSSLSRLTALCHRARFLPQLEVFNYTHGRRHAAAASRRGVIFFSVVRIAGQNRHIAVCRYRPSNAAHSLSMRTPSARSPLVLLSTSGSQFFFHCHMLLSDLGVRSTRAADGAKACASA